MKTWTVNIRNKYTPNAGIVDIDTFWWPNEYGESGRWTWKYFNNFASKFHMRRAGKSYFWKFQTYIDENKLEWNICRNLAQSAIENIFKSGIQYYSEVQKNNLILQFLAYYNYQSITPQSEIQELTEMTGRHYDMDKWWIQSLPVEKVLEDYKQKIWEAYAYMRTQPGTHDGIFIA